MHFDDLVLGWHFARANGPDGFISDDRVGRCNTIGQGTCKLICNEVQRTACFTVLKAFTDANDRGKICGPSLFRLGVYVCVAFLVCIAAF